MTNMATLSKPPSFSLSATATLPPEITGRLLAGVDSIATRMTRRIADGIALPDPRFRELAYLRLVTTACRDAFRTLVRLLNDGRGLRAGDLDRLGSMGAQQAELGVPLEVVFGAYRIAAKVVWQELIGDPALRDDLSPGTVVTVTGQVLEYFDEISAAVGRAYLETRERLMLQRDRDRDRLMQRLLAGDVSPEFRRLAAAAEVSLAPPYRVVACAAGTADAERELDSVWRSAGALLVTDEPGVTVALVPGKDDLEPLCRRVAHTVFGLGPTASTLEQVAPAAVRARRALEVGRRLDPEQPVHRDADVGIFAAISADRDAMRNFIDRVLGPLWQQRPARVVESLATLEALIDSHSVGDAAERLGLHRHTVVYRINRMKQFGVDIDDPAQRNRIWLALRLRRLTAESE
ncbi:MAG: helix-turn-helix domain-containing protein [Candidatus Dormibacteraeota bacterium]|nr:helix-turn-helix domain-containing protein [Candidatus Dormibacteraeota bacterium]